MKYIIGITAYYHDSSACLFGDNDLLFACEEERFTGIKHDRNFPINVLNHIFKEFNLTKEDIEVVCYYEDPQLKNERIIENLKENFTKAPLYTFSNYADLFGKRNMLEKKLLKYSDNIYFSEHHKSHLYYSYYTSPFKNSVVLSIDGVGEKDTVTFGFATKYGITYTSLGKYPNSLGLFYSAMTSYLGFKPNEGEYKLMGLASYGDPEPYLDNARKLVDFKNDKIICDMDYFKWHKSNTIMFDEKLYDLFNVLPRLPEESITEDHKNLAASVQKVYEEVLFKILNFISEKYTMSCTNLCLGGGSAYNGRANGKITKNTKFEHLWIPCAPSDSGSSIGACIAYLVERELLRDKMNISPFLGPKYDDEEILKAINGRKYRKFENRKELNKYVASELNDGKIIGWFYGRIELGSRALGNRSILADPRPKETKDKINKVVKRRESFRPFAPMVTKESQNKFFHIEDDIPYMNQIVNVKDEFKEKLGAITHIDGTSRPQTVYEDNVVHDLLLEFEKLSGFPVLLNTSFNIKDKTIVLTPEDAIETFLDTEMDILVLNNFVLTKKGDV